MHHFKLYSRELILRSTYVVYTNVGMEDPLVHIERIIFNTDSKLGCLMLNG